MTRTTRGIVIIVLALAAAAMTVVGIDSAPADGAAEAIVGENS
jgi:hypothetical protein